MRLMLPAIDFYAFRDGSVTLMLRFLISFVDFFYRRFSMKLFNVPITWRGDPRVAREAEDLFRFWFRQEHLLMTFLEVITFNFIVWLEALRRRH